MITSIILLIISSLIGAIVSISNFLAGDFSIWPAIVLNGLTYFFTALMNWDFALNIHELLNAIKFMVYFDVVYIGIKLLLKFFNWIRGASGIELN